MADSPQPSARVPLSGRVIARITWTLVSVLAVECLVFALAVLPAALFWQFFERLEYSGRLLEIMVRAMAFLPTYVIFAFVLMVCSALSTRITGWRTPVDAELRIADMDWPLLDWARYMTSVHVVRLFAGAVFRATPLWTLYLRLNGADLGRRVYVNSLAVNDHNLLRFDDDVIIGDDVHLSGHTVERGMVKTARVTLGRGVTIGLGSVVGIGVEAGPGAQVGSLSLVPKFMKLEAGCTYVGTPVRRLERKREISPV